MTTKRAVIYTAITGRYDDLKRRPCGFAFGCDSIAFTEGQENPGGWRVYSLENRFNNPKLNSKFYKVNPHLIFPDVEFSLWIDGNLNMITQDALWNLINDVLGDADMALFQHHQRENLFQEAEHCIKGLKDSPQVIFKQLCQYVSEGYDTSPLAGNRLYEGGIILRRHNTRTKKFNEHWWNQILTFSKRDQISLPHSITQTGVKVVPLGGKYDNIRDKAGWIRKSAHVGENYEG